MKPVPEKGAGKTYYKRKQMKKILIPVVCAFLASAAMAADAERTTTTTTTTTKMGDGTITEFEPGRRFIMKETTGPIIYHYGKEVVYETRSGKRLTEEEVRTRIKVGHHANVHFEHEGERRVIRRVVVDD